jgi:RNA recognition motif. (a.k.a. RRM, RBD, or RNP domain)
MLRQPLLLVRNNSARVAATVFAQHHNCLVFFAGNNQSKRRTLAVGPRPRNPRTRALPPPRTRGGTKRRIPPFANDDDDDDDPFARYGERSEQDDDGHDAAKFSSEEEAAYMRILGEHVCEGAEMDVRIVKITRDYALCRPLHLPDAKGKIGKEEMSEYDDEGSVDDATKYHKIAPVMVVRTQVKHVQPPDRLILSLRRVRRVLVDDYQPFRIVLFGLPDAFCEERLEALMRESGPVESIDTTSFRRDPIVFVTFLHKADALAAMRKWNRTKMHCVVGWPWEPRLDGQGKVVEEEEPIKEEDLYRVRCRKSVRQDYRETLQNFLDVRLDEKIARWDETPYERKCRAEADVFLGQLIPYYHFDQMYNEDIFDDIAETSSAYKYSVKNEPGRGL